MAREAQKVQGRGKDYDFVVARAGGPTGRYYYSTLAYFSCPLQSVMRPVLADQVVRQPQNKTRATTSRS